MSSRDRRPMGGMSSMPMENFRWITYRGIGPSSRSADSHTRARARAITGRSFLVLTEEAAGRPGMRVPVVGDAAAFAVDPVPVPTESGLGHRGQALQEPVLQLPLRQAVAPPHHHRRGADEAAGDPTVGVLEG